MDIVIFGTEDCAQLAKFYLDNDSEHNVIGFCVDDGYRDQDKFEGLPVWEWNQIVSTFNSDQIAFFAPLYDNKLRAEKAAQIKEENYRLISYVSSKATCWSEVGENCFIMEDNTIQPFVSIGNNVIMWSGNHIGHHSVIKDNVFFSSHVVLSGHCVVESYCWLGVNASIRDHLTLAEGTFVAMHTMIHKNTKPNKMYMGVPGKPVKDM